MATIVVFIHNDRNRRLLAEWIEKQTDHQAVEIESGGSLSAQAFDLCLLDGHSFQKNTADLEDVKSAVSPRFVPYLLLVERPQAGQLSEDVWGRVDDIIWQSPNSLSTADSQQFQFELRGRIRSLLRTRSLSESLLENQQRLKVLHRLLRHNIRNSLTVITGAAENVGEPEEKPNVDLILSASHRLLGHAEKAQDIDEIMNKHERHILDLEGELERIIDRFKREYPKVNLSIQSEGTDSVTAIVGIERAFEELISNAIRHNPSDEPEIRVTIGSDDEYGTVVVEDSGPSLQEQDRRVLRGDLNPTALDHGSGLGLWLVVWTVRRSNGSVSYETPGHSGNRITIRLPYS